MVAKELELNRPFVPLQVNIIVALLGGSAAIATIMQFFLGAEPIVIAAAVVSCLAGLTGFVMLGAYNVGAWTVLFYTLGNVLIAIYAKTAIGQPLDSHLFAPVSSFVVILTCVFAQLLALLLVRQISVGKPLFGVTEDCRFLAFLSWACFFFGGVFWILNRLFQGVEGSGFGGFTLFRDLLVMAVIARTAILILQRTSRWHMDMWLVFMMLSAAIMGFIDNQKTATALPVIGYFFTVLFFCRGLPWRTAMLMMIGLISFVFVLSPMIHSLRVMGQSDMSIWQRVELATTSISQLIDEPRRFRQVSELAAEPFGRGYYDYYGGQGRGQMLLGRFASVQQIDPVIVEVDRNGPLGGEAIWPALVRLMPSIIAPNKPEHIEAYHTLVYYGLIQPDGGKFPTLPLAGQSYASYGWAGVFVIPFFTFLLFFAVVKKIGWSLAGNVYAIFFLCIFVIIYAHQGDFGQYTGTAFRNFPLFIAFFWFIRGGYRILLSVKSNFCRTEYQSRQSAQSSNI